MPIYWPQYGEPEGEVPNLEKGLAESLAFTIPPDVSVYGADGAETLEYTGARFRARIVSATASDSINIDAVSGGIDEGRFVFNIDSAVTSPLTEGLYRYIVDMGATVDGDPSPNRYALSSGIFNVVDPLSPALSHEEKMVKLLETLLEGKIQGRGDVTFYTIGDRQVGSASVETLRRDLFMYQHQLSRKRYPRQTWQRW